MDDDDEDARHPASETVPPLDLPRTKSAPFMPSSTSQDPNAVHDPSSAVATPEDETPAELQVITRFGPFMRRQRRRDGVDTRPTSASHADDVSREDARLRAMVRRQDTGYRWFEKLPPAPKTKPRTSSSDSDPHNGPERPQTAPARRSRRQPDSGLEPIEETWSPELMSTPTPSRRRSRKLRAMTPSQRALELAMTDEQRGMTPLQRLRAHTATHKKTEGMRMAGRIRHVKVPPPTSAHFRRDAARMHAYRDLEGVPLHQIVPPSTPLMELQRPSDRPRKKIEPRLGAAERLGVPTSKLAEVLMEGSRAKALPRAHYREIEPTSPEALGLPEYGHDGKIRAKKPLQKDETVDTAVDTYQDREKLKRRYSSWRGAAGDFGGEVLDQEFEARQAAQKAQYDKGKDMDIRAKRWAGRKPAVMAFRRLEYEGQKLGEDACLYEDSTVEEEYKDREFEWDDHPGRWDGRRNKSSEWVGGEEQTSSSGSSDTGSTSSESSGDERRTVGSAGGQGQGGHNAADDEDPPPPVTAREDDAEFFGDGKKPPKKKKKKKKKQPRRNSNVSIRSGRSAESIAAGHKKWERLYGNIGGSGEAKNGADSGAGVGLDADDHRDDDHDAGPAGPDPAPVNVAFTRQDKALSVDEDADLPVLHGFGTGLKKRVGMQEDVFEAYRRQDTTVCDSVIGTIKKTALRWQSFFAPVLLRGRAKLLQDTLELPDAAVRSIRMRYYDGVVDVKGIAHAKVSTWCQMMWDDRAVGFAPYWVICEALHLAPTPLIGFLFDQILEPLSVTKETVTDMIQQSYGKKDNWDVGGEAGGWTKRTKRAVPGQSGARAGVNVMHHKLPEVGVPKDVMVANKEALEEAKSPAKAKAKASGKATRRGKDGKPAQEPDDELPIFIEGRKDGMSEVQYRQRLVAKFKDAPLAKRRRVMNFDDFLVVVLTIANMSTEELLAMVFQAFDTDGNGTLDVEEFRTLCDCLNVDGVLAEGTFNRIRDLGEFDVNGDGVLSMPEFLQIREKYPSMFFPAFKLQFECKMVVGREEAMLITHRRDFREQWRATHAEADPPAGEWARTFPHLAHASSGPCLGLRQNCLRPFGRCLPKPKRRVGGTGLKAQIEAQGEDGALKIGTAMDAKKHTMTETQADNVKRTLAAITAEKDRAKEEKAREKGVDTAKSAVEEDSRRAHRERQRRRDGAPGSGDKERPTSRGRGRRRDRQRDPSRSRETAPAVGGSDDAAAESTLPPSSPTSPHNSDTRRGRSLPPVRTRAGQMWTSPVLKKGVRAPLPSELKSHHRAKLAAAEAARKPRRLPDGRILIPLQATPQSTRLPRTEPRRGRSRATNRALIGSQRMAITAAKSTSPTKRRRDKSR